MGVPSGRRPTSPWSPGNSLPPPPPKGAPGHPSKRAPLPPWGVGVGLGGSGSDSEEGGGLGKECWVAGTTGDRGGV